MTRRGFYEKYFISPFFREYKNFSGVESRGDMLRTLMAWGMATLGIIGMLLGQVGLLGPGVGFITLYVVGGLWILWSIVGMCALFARYSKSSGEVEAEDGKSPVTMLGIDKLLTTCCVLFFVLGLLMMSTTLNSGELNMSTGTGESDVDNPILNQDKVEEEPIFNYMNYDDIAPAEEMEQEEEAVDTTAIESFDPAAVSPEAQVDTVTYIE